MTHIHTKKPRSRCGILRLGFVFSFPALTPTSFILTQMLFVCYTSRLYAGNSISFALLTRLLLSLAMMENWRTRVMINNAAAAVVCGSALGRAYRLFWENAQTWHLFCQVPQLWLSPCVCVSAAFTLWWAYGMRKGVAGFPLAELTDCV